jgi:hypothetical protein
MLLQNKLSSIEFKLQYSILKCTSLFFFTRKVYAWNVYEINTWGLYYKTFYVRNLWISIIS